jgi:hypothetical protein
MFYKKLQKPYSVGWLRWLGAMLLLVAIVPQAHAQVNTYTFSQSSGTYTPLSASRTVAFLATASATVDPGLGDDRNFTLPAGTIPFTFYFKGNPYTGVNINTNGYITFGATLPSTSDRNGMTNTTAWDASIVASGRDLSANTNAANLGEISYEVVGTAPNRTFVIQYSKFRPFSSSATFTINLNWQIRLNEANGIASNQTVDIVYGTYTTTNTSTTATMPLVGLRGANTADFQNRTTTTAWNASTAGLTNATTTSMRHTTTVFPASGQTFTWTPPAVCSGAPASGTVTPSAPVTKCANQTQAMSVTGATTGSGISYQWEVSLTSGSGFAPVASGTGATTVSYTTAALTAGTYYYRMTTTCANSGLSTSSPEIVVTVNPLPTVTVSGSAASFCSPGGAAVTLNAGGADTYAWAPVATVNPTTGASTSATPSTNTVYTVTGTDANGCTATSTVAVNSSSAVVITGVTATPSSVCAGGTSTLEALGYLAPSYCGSTHTSGCSGDQITSIAFNTLNTTNSACGVTGATPRYVYYPGSATTVAAGGSYTMTLSFGPDGNQYFGAWIDYNYNGTFDASEFLGASGNAGASGTTSIPVTISPTAYNGVVRMRIIGGNDAALTATGGCGASSSAWGETQDYDITITGGTSLVLGGTNTFSWTETPNNSTLSSTTTNPATASNINVSTQYDVVVTSAAGCSASGQVTVNTGAALACTGITAGTACENENFTLSMGTTGGGGTFTYTWDDGNAGVYPNASTITLNLYLYLYRC